MMNEFPALTRRQFLGSLFGSVVGASIAASLPASIVDAPLLASAPGGDVFGASVVGEAWRLFREIAAQRGHIFEVVDDREYCAGDAVNGLPLRFFFGIDLGRVPFGAGAEASPWLKGPMVQAVEHAIDKGVGVYARLPMARGIECCEFAGPMRYAVCWDLVRATMLQRFDLLGARTEANLRTSWRIRGERTKARLLAERLAPRFRKGMMFSIPELSARRFPA